jgi:hypothetical protein
MNRGVVIVLVVLALLFIGGRHRDEAPPPAPAAVELAVPLSVTETTTPPGWDPPDTAEEQIAAWFVEQTTGWGWNAAGIAITFLILAALVVALERTRAQHQ